MLLNTLDKFRDTVNHIICDLFSCGGGGEDMLRCDGSSVVDQRRWSDEFHENDLGLQSELLKAFETLDTDRDGLIRSRQLFQVVRNLVDFKFISKQDAQIMIRIGGLDEKGADAGLVNYRDFLSALKAEKEAMYYRREHNHQQERELDPHYGYVTMAARDVAGGQFQRVID